MVKNINSNLDLIFQDGDSQFLALTLRVQQEPRELFVHFPKTSKSTITYIEGEKKFKAFFFDHVSFHQDGNVHMTYKNDMKKKDHYPSHKLLTHGLFEIEKGGFFPILAHGLRRSSNGKFETVKKVENNIRKVVNVWDVSSLRECTIFLFAKCESVHPQRWGQKLKLNQLDPCGSNLIWRAFSAKDNMLPVEIVCILSQAIMPALQNKPLDLKGYEEVSPFVILPSMQFIEDFSQNLLFQKLSYSLRRE